MTDPRPSEDGRLRALVPASLYRVRWGPLLRLVLLVLAVSVLVRAITGLDLEALADELTHARWGLVALALAVGQLPRVAMAGSTLGAAPAPVPFAPVYQLQLAQGYVGLAVPTTAARVAMNVRFLQKYGFATGTSLAIGALDSLAGFGVEVSLLVGLIVLTPPSLEFDLDAPSLPDWGQVLTILTVTAVVVGLASLAFPSHRRRLVAWVSHTLSDGRDALGGGWTLRRVALLAGGNLGSTLSFALTLGLCSAALGTWVSFTDLIVIVVAVSLLAGLLPIPGGIGVVEGGLTFGLVAAGVSEEAAFAAALMYRLFTFYLPPTWGYVAFRDLQRRGLL